MTGLPWRWPLGARRERPVERSIAAWRQIVINAHYEQIEEKKKLMRAEKTAHRLFALFRTASWIWR